MNEIKGIQTGKQKKRRHIGLKVVALSLLGLLIIGALGGLFYWSRYIKPQNYKQFGVCSTKLIRESAPLLQAQDGVGLQSTVKTIEALPGYQSDANCMYIVVSADIYVGDSERSAKNLKQLESVYSSRAGYSAEFGTPVQNPEQLRQTVEFLTQQAALYESNANGAVFYGGQTR